MSKKIIPSHSMQGDIFQKSKTTLSIYKLVDIIISQYREIKNSGSYEHYFFSIIYFLIYALLNY